jgi:ribosomal protein L11 methyltransferase
VSAFLELSFPLGALDAHGAQAAAELCGAAAVTFMDAGDEPVLEPAPGEVRLWRSTQVSCLFGQPQDPQALRRALAAVLGIEPAAITATPLADRPWEREWLKDWHARRFGRRLWICPTHEQVADPDAVVVTLDPGLAFGTGTHPSTALCLEWLDARLAAAAVVIDYGCGSGILGLAAAQLGAAAVHAFDIDPQALIATGDNALANGVAGRLTIHPRGETLPSAVDVLLANILASPLCELAGRFAALLRPGGQLVLAGLMEHEAADVTAAYTAWFDVTSFGYRDGWVCLAGRRH